jgi:hypothetical protein
VRYRSRTDRAAVGPVKRTMCATELAGARPASADGRAVKVVGSTCVLASGSAALWAAKRAWLALAVPAMAVVSRPRTELAEPGRPCRSTSGRHNDIVVSVLPLLTPDGVLPPGCHSATWDEMVERFGGSPRRVHLLDGLLRAGQNLRAAGARSLWLGGSFVTAKIDPSDFDGVWDPTNADLAKVDPILVDLHDLRNGRVKQKAKYGGELLIGVETGSGRAFQTYFQQDEYGNVKGIVRLDLRTLP